MTEPTTDGVRDGLEARYRVEKINDPTGKHAACRYFVLDLEHDPLAVAALARYAQCARADGYRALADDLEAWVGEVLDARSRADEDEFIQCPHEMVRATCGESCRCDCAPCADHVRRSQHRSNLPDQQPGGRDE